MLKKHNIQQGNENKDLSCFHQDSFWHKKDRNGYDCGIAVIGIIRRIREKYNGGMRSVKLGEIDFRREREELREKYLQVNN